MITEREWESWMKLHRTLFWMTSPQDADLFGAWRPLIERSGFAFAELVEASQHLAGLDPVPFRTMHLGGIRSRIFAQRNAAQRAQMKVFSDGQEQYQCKTCRGRAQVSVPHVACIVDDAWQYPFSTMVVACVCNGGKVRFNAVNALDLKNGRAGGLVKIRMMDLAEYEALHPFWRNLVAERHDGHRFERAAETAAKGADVEAPIDAAQVRVELRLLQERIGAG